MTIKVSHFVGLSGIGGVQRNFCEYMELAKDTDITHKVYTMGSVDEEYSTSFKIFNILNVINLLAFIRDIVSSSTIVHFYNNLSSLKLFIFIFFLPAKKNLMHERGGVWNTTLSRSFIIRNIVKKMDMIIANSNATKAILNQRFCISNNKIKVIHNGIDVTTYCTKDKVNSEKKFIIGFLGRFDTPKGVKILIDAVKHINSVGNYVANFELHIAGDGPLASCLKDISKNVENIRFIGRVDSPYLFLSKVDLLVVPSIREPLGNVCLEAGLCKVAVIASSVDGIPEIIDDNVSGKLIVPKEKLDKSCFSKESVSFPEVVYFPNCQKIDTPLQVDFKELSGEIVRLMSDDNLRNFYADNLNIRVIKYFNIDRYVSELHNLYRSLL
jgi:glycosyltransferase involved in cell wall biosynthesis